MFEAQRDGYLYADFPGVFDDVEGDGITIEAWIYLTDRPKDGHYSIEKFIEGLWIIFAKPGSYAVSIGGRNLDSGLDKREPEGTTILRFSISKQPTAHDAWGGGIGMLIPPQEYPFSRWVHVAYQIVERKHGTERMLFYDSRHIGNGRKRAAMGRTPVPLVIGGTPLVKFEEGSKWGHKYESMVGFIDEVRVSRGFRYGPGGKMRPRRNFRADAQTIALWHFDEGPGAPIYQDSSGNDYHLFPGGSLAVEARNRLATTLGSLKR